MNYNDKDKLLNLFQDAINNAYLSGREYDPHSKESIMASNKSLLSKEEFYNYLCSIPTTKAR
jgi:hypothetical protein